MCLLSKSRTVRHGSADGPPVLRKIEHRQFQLSIAAEIKEVDGPPKGRGRSAPGQNGGVGQT